MRIIAALLIAAGVGFGQDDLAQRQDNLARRQDELRALEAELKARQAAMRSKYTDTDPGIVGLKSKLEELQKERFALNTMREPPELWWKRPDYLHALGVSLDQQTKINDVFQQYRIKLVDLNATLQKEEITLEPLIAANPLNDAKATAQIDRVAQARAELEKARGRMLFGMRKVLTADQWQKLNNLPK